MKSERSKRTFFNCGMMLPCAAAAMMIGCGGVLPPDGEPGERVQAVVVPPQARVGGLSYAEWSAKDWQWALSLPMDRHPLNDTADCSEGQSGKVWFLGGSFGSTGPDPSGWMIAKADRNCAVPHGTRLFFPIAAAEQSVLESCYYNNRCDPTYDDLRADAKSFTDPAANLSAEVDGVAIAGLNANGSDSSEYRVVSALTATAPQPANSVMELAFGIPDVTGLATTLVSDGYWLMLNPLSTGAHTIHFHAEVPIYQFSLDITYHITVAAGEDD